MSLVYPITVVGTGPGGRDYLIPAAVAAVENADVVVGSRSALAHFPSAGRERRLIGRDLEEVLDFIDGARHDKKVCVLLSGDPCFYSLLPRLQECFGAKNLKVIPGISSLQLACARLGIAWNELFLASVHGRGDAQLADACSYPRVAVLTDSHFTPGKVCHYFLKRGCSFNTVWVMTDLGRPEEVMTCTTLEEGARMTGRGNSVVILLRERSVVGGAVRGESKLPEKTGLRKAFEDMGTADVSEFCVDLATPGIPDHFFVKGTVAMSQEEARSLTICKARLKKGMTVYEIGAGTGAWTVEVARLIDPGTVWAVEKDHAAVMLVRANLERFGISNVVLVEGEAPFACTCFPPADCVLVGGSGGRLNEILQAAISWLHPGGTLVVTAVTPDTFNTAWQALGREAWKERQAVMVNCARVVQREEAQIWNGENPIFILRAERR